MKKLLLIFFVNTFGKSDSKVPKVGGEGAFGKKMAHLMETLPPPDFWNRWYTFYFGNKNTQLCVAISKENVMYAKKYFVEFLTFQAL